MKLETKSRIVVFFLSCLVWFLITLNFNLAGIIFGVILSLITAIFAGGILIVTKRKFHLGRIIYTIAYIIKLFWEMLKANFNVAWIVIHPELPVKPGIVRVKTKLKRDSALTMLANSITLTPGTLTVDINKDKNVLYVHWIYVESTDIEVSTEEIGSRFEKILEEVFE